MRSVRRLLALAASAVTLAAGLTVATAPTASAAESIPPLQYPAVAANPLYSAVVTSPAGEVTVGCSNDNPTQDLVTYSSTGAVVRQISRTTTIDGVTNCITEPIVDKNGAVYGVPWGPLAAGGYGYGPNLLAYSGNTLKWKYPVGCGSDRLEQWAVGADGNIYATSSLSDGLHLIGLTPNVADGQTQPAKIFDVKLPQSDCSTRVRPYKDGLMLHGRYSGNARFYSYSGKYLGQATIGNLAYEKLGADGQLFVASYVSGSYTSAKISMYDPRKGVVAWETIASTPGANVNGNDLYPLPGGGVAAIITEQKMVGGIPASPTEYVKTLVVLDAGGQKVRSVTLSNTNTNGDTYGTTLAYPDINGKIAVVRDMDVKTTVSYPATVPGISIATYSPATDTWPYQQVMSGNTAQSAGSLYGYIRNYAGNRGPVLGNGALFLVAKCTNSCADTTSKLYPLAIPGVGMGYPRGAVLSANTSGQPLPVPTGFLGDSFSSGQGAGGYEAGTVTSTNKCYKSVNAYGQVSSRDPYSPLSLGAFAACGGSITANIDQSGTYTGVAKQDTALTSSTGAVAITIGGNDIGFGDVVTTCVKASVLLGDCDAAIADAQQKLQSLPGKLSRVYAGILSKTSSSNGGANAQIYVLGYGPLLAADAPDCMIGDYPFGGDDKTAAIQLLSDLNQAISDTVVSMGSNRIQYVDPMGTNSPFIGHSLCTSEPYFNGITGPDTSESFHPNTKGQKAYADLLAQYVL